MTLNEELRREGCEAMGRRVICGGRLEVSGAVGRQGVLQSWKACSGSASGVGKDGMSEGVGGVAGGCMRVRPCGVEAAGSKRRIRMMGGCVQLNPRPKAREGGSEARGHVASCFLRR